MGAPAQQVRAQEELGPNEFIFEVVMPPEWRIAEALFAYENNGKYYFPINELAAGFDFLAELDLEKNLATGFAGSEINSFTIDGDRNELIVKGERETLPADAILDSEFLATDDLYVQLEIINRVWPVDMAIELSTLRLVVEAQEELPFVIKREREDKQMKVAERKSQKEERAQMLPRRENAYQYLGKPVVDYQAIYRYDDKEDKLTGSNIFTGVAQIGKMVADFSTNFRLIEGEIERPDNVRLKLSRKSAGEEYLAPGLRSVEFGDVSLRQRDLIANTASGRGIVLSNDNKDRFNEFDSITLEGTGPAGWDIELYNNDELIDFAIVPDNGQYFFEDVTLNFGNNQIKILLFGPQGQVREELRTYAAGGNMLSPGKFSYNVGLLDADRSFILLDNDPRTTPRGLVKTGELSYGVNSWLTAFGGYTELPEVDKDYSYLTAGAAMSTPIGLVETEAYSQINGGNAISTSLVTSALGTRINLGLAKYNNFESSDSGFGDSRKTLEATAQFNKNVKLFSLPLGLRLNTTHTKRKTGESVTSVDTAQTVSRSGMRFSHNTTSRFNDFVHQTTSAGLTTTVRDGPWQLRGNFNYQMHPKWELSSTNAELRYRTDERFQAAVGFGYSFNTEGYNVFSQVGYEWDRVLGTFESRYERGEGWDFVLRATTSLNPYTPDGSYEFSSAQKRQYSPLQAHVFLDKNADGEFNEDDESLEDVRLRIGNAYSQEITNEDGMLMVNAPTDKLVNFAIDSGSLADPYFKSSFEGFSAVPARGNVITANFPIVETGAVEGTAFRTDNDRAVAGLTLELFDASNKKVAEAVIGFDGYYTFEFIMPGQYKIGAAPSHGVTLEDNGFAIGTEDLFAYGNDLFVNIDGSSKEVAAVPAVAPIYGPYFDDANPAAGYDDGLEENMEEGVQDEASLEGRAADDVLEDVTPNFTKAVQDARFKTHNDKARLALDISQDVEYELIPGDDPNKIDIHIRQAAWQSEKTQEISRAGKRYKYEVQQVEDGVVLTLSSEGGIELARSMALPPSIKHPVRLLFDVN